MSPLILFLIAIICQVQGGILKQNENFTHCDFFQATFNTRDVVGTWETVAIIPDNQFPHRNVDCSKMVLTESDGGGLKWLLRKIRDKIPEVVANKLDSNGTTVRQRYETVKPYDVWSKSVEGVNGCFQQVISYDIDYNQTQLFYEPCIMQMHLLETDEMPGPFLVQMLWGNLISAVIYRRKPGVTQKQLKPVYKMLSKLRGPQRLPIICLKPSRDLQSPH